LITSVGFIVEVFFSGLVGPTATWTRQAHSRKVLAMIAEGLGNRAIARRLGISSHTVKFHIAAILDKLGARTRTEAVTIGLRRGP
jgi:DNA-binding NarL/FixJ family response regulator